MDVKIVRIEDIPKRDRAGESLVETLEAWPAMRKLIESGIKKGTAVALNMTDGDLKKYGKSINRRMIRIFLDKFLDRGGFAEYKVRLVRNSGTDHFYVMNPEDKKKPRRQK